MKVVHVIKRIEMIDNDIKELKKLEKSVASNKSFSTPIYMSIEKQINIMLGERIKLLELRIDNPPEQMVEEIEGKKPEEKKETKSAPKKKPSKAKKIRSEKIASESKKLAEADDDDIPMLTQDQIDAKFSAEKKSDDDTGDKILDSALENGSVSKNRDKEKKVKFFRENFPLDTY